MQLPAKPSFLIARLSAIGDCILTLPLAAALKDAYPGCRIVWIVDCAANQFLVEHPAIDETIRVKKGFLKRPKELWQLRSRLQTEKFDVAFDPQGLLKSALLVWLSNARTRIGFDSSQAREKAWWFYTQKVTATKTHIVDKHLELLKPLGIVAPRISFGLHASSTNQAFASQLLESLHFREKGFVIVNVGAGWPSKLWPSQRFAETIRRIHQTYQIPCLVVWGGEQEKQIAESIMQSDAILQINHADSKPCCAIAPSTSLTQLIALIEKAKCILTSDTGPLHMASAVETPIVALFGPTDPKHCGPYQIPSADSDSSIHRVVQRASMESISNASVQGKAASAKSTKEMRKNDDRAMRAIEVEDVMQALDEVLR